MEHKNWDCLKCGSKTYEQGQIRVAGGFWSRIFDVQNKKFISISCQKCGYTEFYKKGVSTSGNVLDFFTR